ncbi:TWiK family of potassium channels protein 7 isoform X2 [Condylostylus longicornis]|uniref:TWiK family of potassium channels protein 7 isoform X2 n=1 Tax=Condylostylus longicornis TaxID=2530218 RepID=UPI00244DBBD6|nr:TWiK family of potassium channels protein 7 isoform X2 [Condylostylus longicornis]
MNRKRSFRRRQKPPFSERAKDHCRKFTAFLFSNVGIILLVVLYTIAGAFMFRAIELSEAKKNDEVQMYNRTDTITVILEDLFNISSSLSALNKTEFYIRVNQKLLEFQQIVIKAELEGSNDDTENDWTFSSSFLYSLTVITTIGYGNIAPKSIWGKISTIIYAIIGMPLFLLYLSNIGDILAKSFKWTYAKLFLCRICPAVTRRRAIRERKKMRQLTAEREMNRSISSSEGSGSSISPDNDVESYDRGMRNYRRSRYYVRDYNNSVDDDRSIDDDDNDVEDGEDDDDDDDTDIQAKLQADTATITVPLTVCICIMIGYILFGATLFHRWENWKLLDGSYFCFISLSSIGFGDIVPGDKMTGGELDKVEVSFILCAVYLLLGMALIAMCFNLMQEQVIHNMQAFKRVLRGCFRCNR